LPDVCSIFCDPFWVAGCPVLRRNCSGFGHGQLQPSGWIFANAKKFEKMIAEANLNKNAQGVLLPTWIHRMLHGNAGGAWNELCRVFLKSAGAQARNPFYVLGFGFGLAKEFGLSGVSLTPF